MAIWSKGGDRTDDLVHAFTVGEDYLYDRELAPYDLIASIAHARMLGESGIIPAADARALCEALARLHREFAQGKWTVEPADEDVHSKVEALLTERIGDAGKRLHTGRSRNDQVLTDVRLWQRAALCALAQEAAAASSVLCARARAFEFHPFPGYTHQQRAMPSSLGMFFGAHAQSLVDSGPLIEGAWELTESCPLGSGASYGVGLPLDRAQVAKSLGFGHAPGLALADANARGKVEAAIADACGALAGDLSRFASDMLFFTTSECGFFVLGQGFTTGSSIMPQKRNHDLFELVRARASRLLGMRTSLAAITIGLTSGYARDLQDTKALCLDGVRIARAALAVVAAAVPTIHPVRERIIAALTPDLYATDEAYRLVRERGIPFRDAYREVGNRLDRLGTPDHEAVVRSRTHAGSTGNLGLERIEQAASAMRARWSKRHAELSRAWDALLGA